MTLVDDTFSENDDTIFSFLGRAALASKIMGMLSQEQHEALSKSRGRLDAIGGHL